VTAPPGLQCGDVISIFDYQFDDGNVVDSKYFVVMGYFKNQAMGFLTTSKAKGGRKAVDGCHLEYGNYPSNYYLRLKDTDFANGTWVLLHIESHDSQGLIGKLRDGKAVRVLTFSGQIVRALRNCFEKSLDWAPICASYMCG
jgi:hypothetical protein